MATTHLDTQEVNTYWRLIKHLSDGVKLRLISLLSQSITPKAMYEEMNKDTKTARFLEEFCGAWKGDASADEIITVIEQSRTSKDPLAFK